MFENSPHSSSPVSSPSPSASRVLPRARPHWPRPTYSHRSSQSSLSSHSISTARQESWDQRSTTGSSSSNTMWQHTAVKRASTGALVASEDDLTRYWSFTVSLHARFLWDCRRYDILLCARHLSGSFTMSQSFGTLSKIVLKTSLLGQNAMSLKFSGSLQYLEMESINLK